MRRTAFGTDRASGGAYERPYIVLDVFGSDGLLSRMELFDPDREAEALSRFDQLALSHVEGRCDGVEDRWTRTP